MVVGAVRQQFGQRRIERGAAILSQEVRLEPCNDCRFRPVGSGGEGVEARRGLEDFADALPRLLAGEAGPGGIRFDDVRSTYLVGSVALSILALYAGMSLTRWLLA